MAATAPDTVIAKGTIARDLLAVVAAIGIGWLTTKLWLYPALYIPENAPMILRPILGFAAAWILLALSGRRWSDFGLRRPTSLLHLFVACCILYAVVYLLSSWLVPVLAKVFSADASSPFLAYIRGNTFAFIGWLAIAWLVGGFYLELRGNRANPRPLTGPAGSPAFPAGRGRRIRRAQVRCASRGLGSPSAPT